MSGKETDIKVSFSRVTLQKTAFREAKENLMYLLEKYDKIMKNTALTAIKQGQVHENLNAYIQKTKTLNASAESMFQTMENQMEQWKDDFEKADEELYEE